MPWRSADWIAQAKRDVQSAQAQGGFFEWACFASQQAAEKAVKAVLAKRGATSWGHAITSLLEVLRDEVTKELWAPARLLDSYYLPARYPNGWADGAPKDMFRSEDAQDAIRSAQGIIRFCDGLLAGTRLDQA